MESGCEGSQVYYEQLYANELDDRRLSTFCQASTEKKFRQCPTQEVQLWIF